MDLEAALQEIGRGRLGRVFKGEDRNGNATAIKVFTGEDLLVKLANYFFTGAPNHYIWSEDAVLTAHYRREVLKELIPYWTDSKVKIAQSLGVGWNKQFKAYQLETEFIDGRHAALHHPFSKSKEDELSDLVENVMKPLQRRFIELGFDGLVWQAGKGVPVASANFMRQHDEGNHWVMIDAESGVPAMMPLNLLAFFAFYLPKSIRHKRPLFDDVDITKLRAYVDSNNGDLENKIGQERFSALVDNIDHLEFLQEAWRSMRRADRSINYQLKKGNIAQEQADRYSSLPSLVWYSRETGRLLLKSPKKLFFDLPKTAIQKLASIDYAKFVRSSMKFLSSKEYRSEIARDYLRKRIDVWEGRKQLESNEADYLRAQLEDGKTLNYSIDFFVHGSFKVVDVLILAGSAVLYAADVTTAAQSIGLGLFGGSIMRTVYTAGMIAGNALRPKTLEKMPSNLRQTFSETRNIIRSDGFRSGSKYAMGKILGIDYLIALTIGAIPELGNAAYPVQMIYSGSNADRELGKFFLYDFLTRIGQKVPVYGGRDTLTEHFFNHIPDIIVRNRGFNGYAPNLASNPDKSSTNNN